MYVWPDIYVREIFKLTGTFPCMSELKYAF